MVATDPSLAIAPASGEGQGTALPVPGASDAGRGKALPAPRACDADRDEVLAMLREGAASGRLSHETFVARMEAAVHARHANELAAIVCDLRPVPPPRRTAVLLRAVSAWSGFTAAARGAWQAPRLPTLVLPRGGRLTYTIGRSGDCDLVIADPTVSGHHAELRRAGNGWVLADVGSLNGTRVNGWRAGNGWPMHAGDLVVLGRARLRVTD